MNDRPLPPVHHAMRMKELWISCFVALLLTPAACPGQETGEDAAQVDGEPEGGAVEDPFAAYPGQGSSLVDVPRSRAGERRETYRLRIEIWEVESLDLVRALDAGGEPAAVEGWRRKMLDGASARLVHAPVLVLEAKSAKTAESMVEEIYPTEYEPPEILPAPVLEKHLERKPPESLEEFLTTFTTGAAPTAFETRNTGVTVEAELQPVEAEVDCVDLSLAFEEVRKLAENNSFGPEALQVTMPVFAAFRATGLQRLKVSTWSLFSAGPPADRSPDAAKLSRVLLVRVDPGR